MAATAPVFSPQCRSTARIQAGRHRPIGRRIGTIATLGFLASSISGAKLHARAFDFGLVAPDQTLEQALSGIGEHAQGLLDIKEYIDSESWKDAQQELRRNAGYLKQDIYTIIQNKPGKERPVMRKRYSDLFNDVTRLDYAARDMDKSLCNLIVMRALALLMTLLQLGAAALGGVPQILKLERAFPLNDNHGTVDLSHRKARDKARRLGSVVDFPVYGAVDQVGLYYTRLQLGTPPKEFYVQIDSGSDALWVACKGCTGCPQTTGLNIPLSFYDPAESTTATSVSCTDQKCSTIKESLYNSCSISSNQCSYRFRYGDGSSTSGYYVQDLLSIMTLDDSSVISNTSASIVFGCSTSQTGPKPRMAVDGIFGLGQNDASVISQLASQGVAPRAFSHCLKGSDGGGGILVLGEVVEPNMVYSPLVPGQRGYYNLNLQSISVNQQILPIDPALFSTSDDNRGTIIDSGTTLIYMPEEAYDIFVNAISNAVVQFARYQVIGEYVCYTISGSVDTIFPPVSLNFAGDASMRLRPKDYLFQRSQFGDSQVWCIGFQSGPGITIVGDLALKDKIIVYDLAGQRIGWADYDCSSSLNVSTSSHQSEFVTARQISKGDPVQIAAYWLTAFSILISFSIQTLLFTYPVIL